MDRLIIQKKFWEINVKLLLLLLFLDILHNIKSDTLYNRILKVFLQAGT